MCQSVRFIVLNHADQHSGSIVRSSIDNSEKVSESPWTCLLQWLRVKEIRTGLHQWLSANSSSTRTSQSRSIRSHLLLRRPCKFCKKTVCNPCCWQPKKVGKVEHDLSNGENEHLGPLWFQDLACFQMLYAEGSAEPNPQNACGVSVFVSGRLVDASWHHRHNTFLSKKQGRPWLVAPLHLFVAATSTLSAGEGQWKAINKTRKNKTLSTTITWQLSEQPWCDRSSQKRRLNNPMPKSRSWCKIILMSLAWRRMAFLILVKKKPSTFCPNLARWLSSSCGLFQLWSRPPNAELQKGRVCLIFKALVVKRNSRFSSFHPERQPLVADTKRNEWRDVFPVCGALFSGGSCLATTLPGWGSSEPQSQELVYVLAWPHRTPAILTPFFLYNPFFFRTSTTSAERTLFIFPNFNVWMNGQWRANSLSSLAATRVKSVLDAPETLIWSVLGEGGVAERGLSGKQSQLQTSRNVVLPTALCKRAKQGRRWPSGRNQWPTMSTAVCLTTSIERKILKDH